MDNLKAKLKKFLKVEKKKKFKKESFYALTNVYWNIILAFMAVTLFLLVVFGFVLFTRTNTEIYESTSESALQETINLDDLRAALDYFKNKERVTSEILNEPSPIQDPSI